MNCFRFTIHYTYLFICLTLSFIINVSINFNHSHYVYKWCADRFIVCGQNYQNVRKAMLKSIFGNDQNSLKNALEVSFIFICFHSFLNYFIKNNHTLGDQIMRRSIFQLFVCFNYFWQIIWIKESKY